jgi:hypothetical protein
VAALPPELHYTLDWHARDRVYAGDIMRWVEAAHPQWMRHAYECIHEGPSIEGTEPAHLFRFLTSYLLWHYQPQKKGVPVGREFFVSFLHFLPERGDWVGPHLLSWLGMWEVHQVEPGRSLYVRDLLTREERMVTEREGSRVLKPMDTMLARVVDLDDGSSVLTGSYPWPLPPRPTETARQLFMSGCFPRRRRLKPAELRSAGAFLSLKTCWELAAREWFRRPPPSLHNFHGEPIEWCIDRFTFASAARTAVLERLQSLGEAFQEADAVRIILSESAPRGPLPTITVGTIRVGNGECQAQANSVPRADRLRALILERAGDLLTCCNRERGASPTAPAQPASHETVPPEVLEALHQQVREIQLEHMRRWPDSPLPVLEGKTPRQAAATHTGRNQLRLLLKELAFHQARFPQGQRISLDFLYAELGLQPDIVASSP